MTMTRALTVYARFKVTVLEVLHQLIPIGTHSEVASLLIPGSKRYEVNKPSCKGFSEHAFQSHPMIGSGHLKLIL